VLTAAGSALVVGASPSAMDNTKRVRVKVLRPFLLKTERQEKDAEIEMDARLAIELVGLNKVEILKAKPAPVDTTATKPIADEAKPSVAAGKKKGA